MFICSASSPRLCVHSPEEPLETIRGTSTVPPCGYSVTIRGNHPHLTIWKAKERKEKKTKKTEQTNNKQICMKE